MIIRNLWSAATLVILCCSANAKECALPAKFIDTPPPRIAAAENLVTHTERVEVSRSVSVVLDAANKPLEDQIQESSDLPGVGGSVMLTAGEFGAVGSRRLNCLTDGSTLVEQVLVNEGTRFRYVVWNYTSEKADKVVYGVGEFVYQPLAADRTMIHWTYSFQLDTDRFPGSLGGFGR